MCYLWQGNHSHFFQAKRSQQQQWIKADLTSAYGCGHDIVILLFLARQDDVLGLWPPSWGDIKRYQREGASSAYCSVSVRFAYLDYTMFESECYMLCLCWVWAYVCACIYVYTYTCITYMWLHSDNVFHEATCMLYNHYMYIYIYIYMYSYSYMSNTASALKIRHGNVRQCEHRNNKLQVLSVGYPNWACPWPGLVSFQNVHERQNVTQVSCLVIECKLF